MKKFSTRTLVMVTVGVAAACATLFLAIRALQDASMETQCRTNLKQIGLALRDYESTYSRLPLAIEVTQDGKLWRSWRTHVYPTFMVAMGDVYDTHTAWDSQTNLRLVNGTPIPIGHKDGTTTMTSLARIPRCFACPKGAPWNANGINYVVVRGEKTAFPKSAPIKLTDIADGLDNTILVVESVTCTPDWTEPRDLDFETMDFIINSAARPSISSFHPSGALVCFADLEVFCITPRVTESELKAMLTIAGGEDISRNALVTRGVLFKR
ncbi:MAG: DUF1559 domain-containing protein [Pirellulales bacterium]